MPPRVKQLFRPDRRLAIARRALYPVGHGQNAKSGEETERAKPLEIRAAVHNVHVPKDIVVSRPEEFQWRKDTVGTIEHPAAQEGQILYAPKMRE